MQVKIDKNARDSYVIVRLRQGTDMLQRLMCKTIYFCGCKDINVQREITAGTKRVEKTFQSKF